MEMLEGIYTRRSVRKFTKKAVARDHLLEMIRAGTFAPSGMNNQPWRFVIVIGAVVRRKLAQLTHYGRIIEDAGACIAVFIDKNAMYHAMKDHQALGACIENMLLAAHGLALGAVWLGEILKNAEQVRILLELPANLELMAVVAVGHPAGPAQVPPRRGLDEVILKEI